MPVDVGNGGRMRAIFGKKWDPYGGGETEAERSIIVFRFEGCISSDVHGSFVLTVELSNENHERRRRCGERMPGVGPRRTHRFIRAGYGFVG